MRPRRRIFFFLLAKTQRRKEILFLAKPAYRQDANKSAVFFSLDQREKSFPQILLKNSADLLG
jgi:hypothetical protein